MWVGGYCGLDRLIVTSEDLEEAVKKVKCQNCDCDWDDPMHLRVSACGLDYNSVGRLNFEMRKNFKKESGTNQLFEDIEQLKMPGKDGKVMNLKTKNKGEKVNVYK